MNLAIIKNLPHIPQLQAPKTSSSLKSTASGKDNKAIPKLSKPLFPATTGSFSASNISATTKNSKAAKAESPQPATCVNKYNKKRKLTEPEPEVAPEPIVVTTKKAKKKQQLELKKKQQKEEQQLKQNNKNAQAQANKKRIKRRHLFIMNSVLLLHSLTK